MKRILDCMVTYFGLDEDGRPTSRRYFCYHVVAGPGPTAGAAVASIVTLAVYDEARRHRFYQNLHTVESGGAPAAIGKAIRYLDAHHGDDCVRRVQSEIRGLGGDPPADVALPALPDPCRMGPLQDNDTPKG